MSNKKDNRVLSRQLARDLSPQELETITGGQVLIEGVDITDKKTDINKIRTEVGMVFQQFILQKLLRR